MTRTRQVREAGGAATETKIPGVSHWIASSGKPLLAHAIYDVVIKYAQRAELDCRQTLCWLELQEALGVQMADLLLIRRADRHSLKKFSSLLIRAIRVIDREEDAIRSHGL